jgi:hypothetical protein
MPERLFLFVQCELPWALGPPDGRYLLRSHDDGEPERVVVLGTLGAGRATLTRGGGRSRRRAPARRRAVPAEPEPEPVVTTRATIIDPVSVSAERQARAWLAELDSEREVSAAFAALNRVLHARRIAEANAYTREVSPAQALTLRAGWGEGEQVADGLWLHAVRLPWSDDAPARGPDDRRSRRSRIGRASALRPDERMAELLGAREQPLLCEELVLRARLDLDQGRLAHATIELDRALLAALGELGGEQRADLPLRVSELRSLHADVAAGARATLGLEDPATADAQATLSPQDPTTADARAALGPQDPTTPSPRDPTLSPRDPTAAGDAPRQPDEETIRHALGRLEAALRARSAAGYGRSVSARR